MAMQKQSELLTIISLLLCFHLSAYKLAASIY